MVFIFGGIDLPVFEILFIIAVLMLVGIVILFIAVMHMLQEIKDLKKILKEEEKDIQRFEKDLEKFEGKTNQNTKEIKEYIQNYLNSGYDWNFIKNNLIKLGWDTKVLEKIYKEIRK